MQTDHCLAIIEVPLAMFLQISTNNSLVMVSLLKNTMVLKALSLYESKSSHFLSAFLRSKVFMSVSSRFQSLTNKSKKKVLMVSKKPPYLSSPNDLTKSSSIFTLMLSSAATVAIRAIEIIFFIYNKFVIIIFPSVIYIVYTNFNNSNKSVYFEPLDIPIKI